MEVLRQKFAKNKYHRHNLSGVNRKNINRDITKEMEEHSPSPDMTSSYAPELRSRLKSRNTNGTEFSLTKTQIKEGTSQRLDTETM